MAASRSVLSFVRHAVLTVCASIVCVLVASCTVPATQLLVSIDTDFYVPGELDTIRVRVLYASDVEGSPEETRAFTTPPPLEVAPGTEVVIGGRAHAVRRTVDFMLGEGASGLPIELSLVPASGDDERVALIEAFGMKDGVVRAIGSVRSRFARHRTARVSVFVFVACADIACPAESTCGAGGACIPNQIDPSCLDDPRLCPDAAAPPPDAAREDASIAMIEAGPSCGNGTWDPETEECDGTSDCSPSCTLLVPPAMGTCDSPILITPTGRHSGSYRGQRDDLRSFHMLAGSYWGRDLVFAIDLGASPTNIALTPAQARTVYSFTTECPTTGARPRAFDGAYGNSSVLGAHLEARNVSGRLYLVLDESTTSGPDYDETYDFTFTMPSPGAGTCADPLVLASGGLYWHVTGTESDVLASGTGSCAGRAGLEIYVDEPTGVLGTQVQVDSSDDGVLGARVASCAIGAPSAPCAVPGASFSPTFLASSGEETARLVVDGILPGTEWVAFYYTNSR